MTPLAKTLKSSTDSAFSTKLADETSAVSEIGINGVRLRRASAPTDSAAKAIQ
jgi:hypothetical protein